MANPSEYHTMMFEFFYNGNLPAERKDKDGKVVATKTTPKKALDEFEDLMAMQRDPERQAKRAAALQARLEREKAKREAPAG
jgi:hypothetical protein